MVKKTFNIKGMHCRSCEMLIKDAVTEIDGVKSVSISLEKNTATIDYDDKKVKDAQIKKAIEKEGYKVG